MREEAEGRLDGDEHQVQRDADDERAAGPRLRVRMAVVMTVVRCHGEPSVPHVHVRLFDDRLA